MKKFLISPIDNVLKATIIFLLGVIAILFTSTILLAEENSLKLVNSTGRSVIIDNDEESAKKRALEDALYLASLQGGAKVDGFSSIDNKTNLSENLLVRPSSEIIDFKVLEESSDKTHYKIKIQAALLFKESNINCSQRKKIKLSFLKPHFIVSSELPAWTNQLPNVISEEIYKNISSYKDVKIIDKRDQLIDPDNLINISSSLSYESIMGNNVNIKNGEFSVVPYVYVTQGKSRLHRFSREIIFSIILKVFQGPSFEVIDNINYDFSLISGNKTGYSHIDAFYKVPIDKLLNQVRISLSQIHFRVLDQLKCVPLETKVVFKNQKLIAPLGTNQGLYTGKIGIVSNNNPDNSMKNWSVVSVLNAQPDYSVLETLNSDMDKSSLTDKIIRFID